MAGQQSFTDAPLTPEQAKAAYTDAPLENQPPPTMNFAVVNGVRVPLDGLPEDIQTELRNHSQQGDTLLANVQSFGHLAAGAVRGAVGTVQTIAKPLRWAAGMEPATPPPAETTTAGKIGRGLEQIGELLVPASKVAKASQFATTKLAPALTPYVGRLAGHVLPAMAVESAGGAALSAAQGGDPRVGAVLGAAVPVVSAVVRQAPNVLYGQAQKRVEQALGGTKEEYKAMGESIAPEFLRRLGLKDLTMGGSRVGLQRRAEEAVEQAGQQVDAALKQYGQQQHSTQPILDALEAAQDQFRTITTAGKVLQVERRAIRQLDGLQKIVTELGPDATVDQLVAVRRAWDNVVAQAGGYAHRAPGAIGMPLKERSEAWAKREGAGAIRKLLDAAHPDLSAVNKEFAFWKRLDDVLTQTIQRTTPQGSGLSQMIFRGAGLAAGVVGGFQHGGVTEAAIAGYAVGKMAAWLQHAFTSPRWRNVSAKLRYELAHAIADNNAHKIAATLGRIGAVQASTAGGSK